MPKKYLRILPLIFWCAVIFYMSSQDAVTVAESRGADIFIHKLAHLIEYAILYLLFIFALEPSARRNPRFAVYGIILVALYGLSDEIHQSFNPTRSPRVYDIVVDTLGGMVGYLLTRLYFTKHQI